MYCKYCYKYIEHSVNDCPNCGRKQKVKSLSDILGLFKKQHPTLKQEEPRSESEELSEKNEDSSPSVTGNGVSTSKEKLAISQYSEFPRYYTIDGVKYDIDDPEDIVKIPLIKTVMFINGKPYGMDTILNEHCVQATSNMDIHWAAYNKVAEFRDNGIIHKSDREIKKEQEYKEAQEERAKKEEARRKQCDSFTIDDMSQFSDIPFAWHCVKFLFHTEGVPWFMLNWNNQQIALQYISHINDIIVDSHGYIDNIGDAHIDLDNIDFDYPHPMYKNCMACTRLECYPYTSTGKVSKYPAILQFATKPEKHDFGDYSAEIRTSGEIKILRDGNIGMATVHIGGKIFKIGLHGLSLVLKRVDNRYTGKNLFMFSEAIE